MAYGQSNLFKPNAKTTRSLLALPPLKPQANSSYLGTEVKLNTLPLCILRACNQKNAEQYCHVWLALPNDSHNVFILFFFSRHVSNGTLSWSINFNRNKTHFNQLHFATKHNISLLILSMVLSFFSRVLYDIVLLGPAITSEVRNSLHCWWPYWHGDDGWG